MIDEITFVRTSHFYQSYTDLLKLIELNGFPIIKESEFQIDKEGVYIFTTMNGDVEARLANELNSGKRALWSHRILWNLERPPGSAGIGSAYLHRQTWLMNNRFFDEIWVSDKRLEEESGLRFVVLGSDDRLGDLEPMDKIYDFCHMSYEVNRRQTVYQHFLANKIAPNAWPPERDNFLRQSKFGVAIHQDWLSFQEPLRLALFASYGLPIISESLYNSYPWSEETIIQAPRDTIVSVMKKAFTEDYEPYREMGLRGRKMMTQDFQFGNVVREAVQQTIGWR